MTIYILTEIYSREVLNLKNLFKYTKAGSCPTVHFVDQSVFLERFKLFPIRNSIVLVKDLQAQRRNSVALFKRFNNVVVAYDIESLLYFGFDRFVYTRLDNELLRLVDYYLVPTKHLLDSLASKYPECSHKFILAASPKLQSKTSNENIQSIKRSSADPISILIVSNFATLYPRTSEQSTIDDRLLSYAAISLSQKECIAHYNDLYRSYLKYARSLLCELIRRYPDLAFFYRPHPFENLNDSNHFINKSTFSNVQIVSTNDSFYKQILSVDLVLSSMSTVSIELSLSSHVPIVELSPEETFFKAVEPPLTHHVADHIISSVCQFSTVIDRIRSHKSNRLIHMPSPVATKPSIPDVLCSIYSHNRSFHYHTPPLIVLASSFLNVPFSILAVVRSLIAQMFVVGVDLISALSYNPIMKNPVSYLLIGSTINPSHH